MSSDDLDLPNPANVREVLSSDDTLPAIKDFQNNHGILLPSLKPALPLLDLHGISRLEFHQSVFEEFKSKLLSKIKEISVDNNNSERYFLLLELLNRTMPAIKVKILRPVVMCLMQQLPTIPRHHLQVLENDKELYKESSVEVKQQIWMLKQSLFGDEVSPLFTNYIEAKEEQMNSLSTHQASFFQVLPKTQRNSMPTQQLVIMVGKRESLYEMVLQFIRTLFLRMKNRLYCTLRSELLMSFHDKEVSEILTIDACHKFAWCLDACIREKYVDHKRSRELQGFLDSVKQMQAHVLGDISMILCDPHSIHTLSKSVIKHLITCINNDVLPRSSEELHLLVRLLSIGIQAWDMINNRNFIEPKPDLSMFTKVLPCISSLITDDLTYSLTHKQTQVSSTEQVSPYLVKRCNDDLQTFTIVLFYVLHAAKHAYIDSLIKVLPVLARSLSHIKFHQSVLNELVHLLVNLSDHISSNQAFFNAVFNQFFLILLQDTDMCRQTMRLIWFIHNKLPQSSLESLIQLISPHVQETPSLQALYDQLNDRINESTYNQQQQSFNNNLSNVEFLQSPLTTVPTPHAHIN